jgi:hypothetical protein
MEAVLPTGRTKSLAWVGLGTRPRVTLRPGRPGGARPNA